MKEYGFLDRTELLLGEENMNKLKHSHVLVVGLGGVGSYIVEGLCRAGLGEITICDFDTIDITNLNRQLQTNVENVGHSKVEVTLNRIKLINPCIKVNALEMRVDDKNINSLFELKYDYVCDAIDSVSAKLLIIEYCKKNDIDIISSMGTGNKLDAGKFEITDIYKTSVCPLAKVMRKECKNRNVKSLKVLYSNEEPKKCYRYTEGGKKSPASISFVPSVAGLLIAGEVIRDLIGR